MGWMTMHREKGQTDMEFFQRQVGDDYQVLETGRSGRAIYLAVRHPQGYVFGMVCLFHLAPRSYYNFGYKDMDESTGPYEDNCPEKVYRHLTPLEEMPHVNEYSRDWRERVEANLAAKRAMPKIKKGDTIILDEPITLTNGDSLREFVFDGGYRARYGYYNSVLRLPKNWKRRFSFRVA